ncbi:hypothetical protein [Clostridium aminobutyricum]|uniref:Uncharacterized protein n=1 Tax=Clostridium aminobutyricum TaxID=33953 RepID=A0A939D9X2_CLOAM|nr:hypothetical protein [Clostridium aminobutyricum]MBN7773752.1 hypothetical protein [Clostridium aminobutyricum]
MDIPSINAGFNSGSLKNYENSQFTKTADSNVAGQAGAAQSSVFAPVDKDVDTNLPVNGTESASSTNKIKDGECQTCKNRKYQDESNDSGVSYQTPTKLGNNVASSVRAHEQEHVSRNQMKAEQEDREVVSQTVMLHTAVCPECGKTYVSGGTTRTVTRADQSSQEPQYNAIPDTGKGGNLDITV